MDFVFNICTKLFAIYYFQPVETKTSRSLVLGPCSLVPGPPGAGTFYPKTYKIMIPRKQQILIARKFS